MIESARDYVLYKKEAADEFLYLSRDGMNAVFLYSGNVCHNGKIVPYDSNKSARTISVSGKAFVPVQYFVSFCGGNFCGDVSGGTLAVCGKKLEIKADCTDIKIDGEPCSIKSAPVTRNDLLYLPLEEIASLVGYSAKTYYENRLTVTGKAEHISALDNDPELANAGAYLVCGRYEPEACGREDYHAARMNWRKLLVGSPELNDMSVPAIASKVEAISNRCKEKWTTLNKNKDRVILWGDSAPTESADLMHQSVALADLAKGWGTYGSEFYHNEELYKDIIDAVWWLYYNMYGEDVIAGKGWRDAHLYNWYHWYTAFPENMTDVFFIMEDPDTGIDAFTLEDKRRFFKCWDWLATFNFVGVSRDKVQARTAIYAKIALTEEDPERMYAVYVDYDMYTGLTENEDGPRVDYTHWWHGAPYNMCYAAHNIDRTMRVLSSLSGTGLEIVNPKIYGWFDFCKYMYEPAIYKGQGMLALDGRFVTTTEMWMGAWILVRMMLMIGLFGEDEDNYIRTMIRRHADTPDLIKQMADRGYIENCIELAKIMEKPLSEEEKKYNYAHSWFAGDRAAWHRTNYAVSFAIHSKREPAFECINEMNMTGWHMGDGALYLYTDYDRHQYDGVNFIYKNREIAYHFPGTTEDRRERDIRHVVMPEWFRVSKSYAGSISFGGQYLTCAMDFESYNFDGPDDREDNGYGMGLAPHTNDLVAKKAWFCFDKELVALGAGINSTMNSPVDTTVEHRRLVPEERYGQFVGHSGDIDSFGQAIYEKRYTDPDWVCMDGHSGYYFPDGGDVYIRRYISVPDEESGVFGNNLEEGIEWEKASQPFFEVRLEHGENPKDATYSYVILPYATPADLDKYSKEPEIEIISNTPALQAVRKKSLGVTGYVFYEPGKCGDIETNQPVMIMSGRSDDLTEIRIADPSHELESATVIVSGDYEVISHHERIKAVCEDGSVKISINFDAANGRGLDIVLRKV